MISHSSLWTAIDHLAKVSGLSSSGLARRSGLDPTSFNKSKRISKQGRERWPSMESIVKILTFTNTGFDEFYRMIEAKIDKADISLSKSAVASSKLCHNNSAVLINDNGQLTTSTLPNHFFAPLPNVGDYAVKISGNDMLPFYRDGDTIVVSPTKEPQIGDRVLIKTTIGKLVGKVLLKRTTKEIDLMPFDTAQPAQKVKQSEVDWIAAIIWASQ